MLKKKKTNKQKNPKQDIYKKQKGCLKQTNTD